MRFSNATLAAAALAGAMLAAQGAQAKPTHVGDAAQAVADIQKALSGKRFEAVHVAEGANGLVLSGQVSRLADKIDAEKKADKRSEGVPVDDEIQVAVPEGLTDAALHDKLARKLVYDRVGYGTTVFNNITLQVKDGVVTLGGLVYGPPDKDSAISVVTNELGVRGLVDQLQVAPLSPNDDRIRLQERAAIYGFGQLNKYAIDPAKTIRISVVNGHVTLNGVVDNVGDRNVAFIRANGVPGVFSVENDLQVAGQTQEALKQ